MCLGQGDNPHSTEIQCKGKKINVTYWQKIPVPGLGQYLDSYYFENSRVSYTLDLMESELLILCDQRTFVYDHIW